MFRDEGIDDTYGTLLDDVRVELVRGKLEVALAYGEELTITDDDLVSLSDEGEAVYEKDVPFRVSARVSQENSEGMTLRIYAFDDFGNETQVDERSLAPGEYFETVVQVAPASAGKVGVRSVLLDDATDTPFLQQQAEEKIFDVELRAKELEWILSGYGDEIKTYLKAQGKKFVESLGTKVLGNEFVLHQASLLKELAPNLTDAEAEAQVRESVSLLTKELQTQGEAIAVKGTDRLNAALKHAWNVRIGENDPARPAVEQFFDQWPSAVRDTFDAIVLDEFEEHADKFIQVDFIGFEDFARRVEIAGNQKALSKFFLSRDVRDIPPGLSSELPLVKKLALTLPYSFEGSATNWDGKASFVIEDVSVAGLPQLGVKANVRNSGDFRLGAFLFKTFEASGTIEYDSQTKAFKPGAELKTEIKY